MSEEINKVLGGEYNNPKLSDYKGDLLYASLLTLDLSQYLRVRTLFSNVVTDNYFEQNVEHTQNDLGL